MGKAARLKAERRREATRPPAGPAVRHGSSPMEHVAAHEAGHAVVQWTLNLPFDYVSLDTSPAGVWPLDGVKKHMGDTWLIGAAGCIADLQLRELVLPDPEILKLVLGSPDSLFSVVDRSGTVVVRPSRNPAVAPGGDLHMMAVVMSDDGDGVPWPAAEIIGVWRDCERYVAACRGAIEAVAAELLRVRKLTYFATGHIAAKAAGSGPCRPYRAGSKTSSKSAVRSRPRKSSARHPSVVHRQRKAYATLTRAYKLAPQPCSNQHQRCLRSKRSRCHRC